VARPNAVLVQNLIGRLASGLPTIQELGMPRSQYRERDGGIVSSARIRSRGNTVGDADCPLGTGTGFLGNGNAASQHKKAAHPRNLKADGNLPSEGPAR